MESSRASAPADRAKSHKRSASPHVHADRTKSAPPPHKQQRNNKTHPPTQRSQHQTATQRQQTDRQHHRGPPSSFPPSTSPHSSAQPAHRASHAPVIDTARAAPASKLHHPFRANFNDHFETSTEALRDVLPFVNELRQLLRPSTPEKLTIYDPYYCSGAIIEAWHGLGVANVLHDNRDFYADIANGTVPGPYDVLVTNPPFSDDHIWRLLDFLVSQKPLRPWAFVAPDYIAAKPQYKSWVRRHFTATATVPSPGPAGAVKGAVRRPPPPIPSIESILPPFLLPPEEGEGEARASTEATTAESTTAEGTSRAAAAGGSDVTRTEGSGEKADKTPSQPASAAPAVPVAAPVGPEPFYLIPRVRYDYAHPLGVGHDHSHFKSMWYVWAGRHTSEVLRGVSVALSGRGRHAAPSRATDGTGGSQSAPVTVVNGYQALVEGHHVSATDRRPNPERRQRAGNVGPSSGGGRNSGAFRGGRGRR